jgi:hypothetical protein
VETRGGKLQAQVTEQRTKEEFSSGVCWMLRRGCSEVRKTHVVIDNLSAAASRKSSARKPPPACCDEFNFTTPLELFDGERFLPHFRGQASMVSQSRP